MKTLCAFECVPWLILQYAIMNAMHSSYSGVIYDPYDTAYFGA